MNETLHCISLRAVQVGDNKTLLSAWSREMGRVSFAFPSGTSREGRRRRALSPPLGLFEGRAEIKPGQEILNLRDFSAMPSSPALIPSSIQRNMTSAFIAEVLDHLLRRTAPEQELSDFLFDAITKLGEFERSKSIANFAIIFLIKLARPVGIEPDLSNYRLGDIFDMRDARFRHSAPLHPDYLTQEESAFLYVLARANYKNMHRLQLTPDDRRHILIHILNYYSIHLGELPPIKTLELAR